jgi:hypothetical protein
VFTNLIGTLTGLLPKNFFFGSYMPVLIFGYINGLLLYVHAAAFRDFFHSRLANPLTFATLVLFVASLIVAYVLSSVTDFLREVLEGKHLLPGMSATGFARANASNSTRSKVPMRKHAKSWPVYGKIKSTNGVRC